MPVKKVTKKVVKKDRINPPLEARINEKSYNDLIAGDCFINNTNDLLMKTNEGDEQSAVSLVDGKYYSGLCDLQVIPMDITVNWKKRK